MNVFTSVMVVLCTSFCFNSMFSQQTSELKNDELFIVDSSVPMSASNFGLSGFNVFQGFNFVAGANGKLQAGDDLMNSTIGRDGLEINQFVSDPKLKSKFKINAIEFEFTKLNPPVGEFPVAPNIDFWTIETITKTDVRKGMSFNNVFGDDGLAFDEVFYLGPNSSSPFQNRVGIGTTEPKAKLHLLNGDILLEGNQAGVIMNSPNGNCWKLGVDNAGNPVFTSITCP